MTSSDQTECLDSGINTSTLTFTPLNWNTPQVVTVTGKDEYIDDGDVIFSINTNTATSTDPKYAGINPADVTMTNVDNDTAGYTVSLISGHTTESLGTATFTVKLNSKPATDSENFIVVVDMASSNMAEGSLTTSTLTFTSDNWGENQTVTVTGVNDDVVDGNITYTIILTTNTPTTTDSNYDPLNPADVTVVNDDNDSATVAINSITQLEGPSGTTDFVFTVTHSGAQVIGGYTVSYYSQNGTAKTTDSDFTSVGGSLAFSGSIGETRTITVKVNGDTKVEANETFTIVLSGKNAGGKALTILEAGKIGTGTITNDDSADLSINDASITELNSGSQLLIFTVTLSMNVENGLTVDYTTVNGTATSEDIDYVAKSGTLTFAGTTGETKTISITINGDEKVELNENFLVNLSNIQTVSAPAGTVSFTDNSATGTITNDDTSVISISGFSVSEADGTASYTVTMDKAVQTEFTINFTTSDNSALSASASDYTTVTSTLSFGGTNSLTQYVSIPITNDTEVEPTETLYGTISTLIDGSSQSVTITGGGTTTATGTIIDNDTATLTIDDVTVDEAGGTATFTVTLSNDVQNNFTVQ